MKKTFAKSRLLSIIAAMLLVLCLTACGSQNGGDTKTPEVATPPDLTGEWVQSNSEIFLKFHAVPEHFVNFLTL